MYIDSFLVFDTWSSYPYDISSAVDMLRTINIQSEGYRQLHIEYYSTSSDYRNFHMEWITPSSYSFTTIPNQWITYGQHDVVQYSAHLTTVYVQQPLMFFPLMDLSVFENHGKNKCNVKFSSIDPLPGSVVLDNDTGVITGTLNGDRSYSLTLSSKIECNGRTYKYDSLINVHVVKNFTVPSSLQYRMNDMVVSDISIMVGDSLLLVPVNETNLVHTYSIDPLLPTGLVFDSVTGVIRGKSVHELKDTFFTITLATPVRTIHTTIKIAICNRLSTQLFYGYARGNATSLRYSQNQNINDWRVAEIDDRGFFSFFILPGVFFLDIPSPHKQNCTMGCFTEFSLYRGEGAIVAENNNWFTGRLLPSSFHKSSLIEVTTYPTKPPSILPFNNTSISTEVLSFTYEVGVTIKPIVITVTEMHSPLEVVPPFVNLILQVRNHSMTPNDPTIKDNYVIAGLFEVTGVHVYTISCSNAMGDGKLILKFNITEHQQDTDYLTFSDTILNSDEYFYDVCLEGTTLFHRQEFPQHHNTISVKKERRKKMSIRICRRKGYSPLSSSH